MKETIKIYLYRLDGLINELSTNKIEFVKIDVQRFEYYVLEGFGDLLKDVLCIELETHLIPIYKKEKCLSEICNFLFSRGFYLRHLETVGTFEGEVVEFNAYFVKQRKETKDAKERTLISFWEKVNHLPSPKKYAQGSF